QQQHPPSLPLLPAQARATASEGGKPPPPPPPPPHATGAASSSSSGHRALTSGCGRGGARSPEASDLRGGAWGDQIGTRASLSSSSSC
uniref:Uncharacterized protein n=1 Tax=Oryza meridionalis TaxID=40149 RepID=A0A0E0CM02_9ORYZ